MDKFLTQEQIKEIEEKIGYTFKNKDLLSTAFRRKSFTEELANDAVNLPNNEQLEFYGDSALNLVVVKALAKLAQDSYESNTKPKRNEEELTHFVSNYTDKAMLASIMEPMKLSQYLLMSNGDRKNEVYKEESVLEDLFESIVGAMWFDNNLDIDAIYDYVVRLIDLRKDRDEYYQKNAFVQLKEFVDKSDKYSLYKRDGIYYLSFEDQIIDWLPAGFLRSESIGRYQSMILVANRFIQVIKDMGYWPKPKIELEGITVENAVNKLQELYQQKYLSVAPIYSTGNLDRSINLWSVDCIYNSRDYQAQKTGVGKLKVEAKKQAAYKVYIDLANYYNKQ